MTGPSVQESGKLTARVSTIEDWRWFRDNSDEFNLNWDWFMSKDRTESERMRVGKALHSYLEEIAVEGEHTGGGAHGYVFEFECDAELVLPTLREFRTSAQYGGLKVTGQCDAAGTDRLVDFKFTLDSIDMEQYMESYQWRYYLDMFGRREFQYIVFRAFDTKDPQVYRIADVQKMSVYAYPDLHSDCLSLATEFHDVVKRQPELLTICQEQVAKLGGQDGSQDNSQQRIHQS